MQISEKILNQLFCYENGDYHGSLALAKKLLESHSTSSELCNICGVICLDIKRYSEALEYFKDAIRLQPNFIEAYNNAGTLFMIIERLMMRRVF